MKIDGELSHPESLSAPHKHSSFVTGSSKSMLRRILNSKPVTKHNRKESLIQSVVSLKWGSS